MRPSDDADKGGLGTGAPIVQVYHEKSIILPDVSRVLACLYEKDIKFETHTASYKSLLRLQASSHAPVPFYDGPTFLEESRGICRYIAEKYEHQGYPFLLGKDALERASVEQWLHNEEHAFNPPSRALYCHLAFPLDEEDGDDIDLHTRKLEEVLEVYEQRLSDSRFLAGNKFTLADLVHLPNSHYIKSSEKFVYLYDSRKNVNRWWEEISTRTSWQQVLRDMKRVEEQNRQEELKKQQQQKEHPRTSGHPIRIDSKKHISTEPRTILVPPADTMSSSSIVRPLPTDSFPNAAVVSSSQIIPTADKTSDVLNKETTIFNAPDETTPTSVQSTPTTSIKHPIPVQSIKDDASPTTAKKPPIADDAKYSSKDTSIPESTVEDLHTRQEPNSSKDDSKNFDVFDYYPSHSDEDTPYMKPTPQRTLEISDASSGSNIASGYTKPSSLSAKEEPDQPSASDIYKSDSRATGIDSQYKESGPYSGRTPPKQEPIDTSANKLHTSDVHHKLQAEKWHIATTGLNDLNQDADHLMSTQQGKPSKDVKQYTSQDSEQSTSDPVPEEPMSMEPVQRQENTTGRPYTDQRSRGIVEDTASSDQRSALLLPSIQQHDATPSRQEAAKYGRERIPSQAEYPGGQDINQQPRDPASVPRQRSAQDVRGTFGESKAADSTISSESYPDASRSSLPRQDLDGVRYTTAPFQKRYPGTKDTSKQSKHKISTPWQMADKHAEDTAEETKSSDSSSSQVQPSYFQRADAPSWKQETSKDRYSSTPAIEEKHDIVKDTTGMSRDVAFKPKQAIGQDDQDNFKETKSGGPSLFRNQQPDTWQAASTSPDQEVNQDGHSVAPPSQTRYQSSTHPFETRHQIGKDASKQPRGTAPTPKKKALKDDNGTSEELNTADEVAPTEQLPNVPRAPISPRRQEVDNSSMTNTSFQRRYPDDKEDMQVADTASASRQIAPDGGEGIFEETKLADSTTSEKPLYIQQTALPLPRQAEVEDGGKGRHSRVTIPEQQKMVGRDAQDTRGERQTTTPGEESSDLLQAIPQSSPAAAKDVQSATSETMQFPAILDTTKKSRGAFEETKDPDSTLPRAQSLGARDAQHAIGESRPLTDDRRKDVSRQLQPDAQDPFQQSKLSAIDQKGLGSLSSQERDAKDAQATTSDDKSISTERHKEMIKREPQDSIKVEKISSIYQKRPPVAKDRQEQSQIIEADEKANGSTPKHQQVPDTMYTLDDKLKTTAAPNAKTSFDFGAEETYRKDTTNDQKLVPPLLSKEPPSQVQPTSGSLQDEASNGRLSTKPSTIEQWQRTSVPLNDVTSSSGDDEIGMVTIDQKLTPMSQQATPSAESGNRMAKNSAEKRVEPHVPSEAETSGVRSASPSFPEASTGHHDTTDDKFPKQSIIDGRVEESRKMQTSTPDSAPAHTRIGTPGGHEIGDSELVSIPDGKIPDAAKTRHGQGTLQEDVHDANLPTHDVAKDTFTETEVVDFRPSSAKPMYTQRPAPTPRHAEAEDTRNKGTKGRETVPDQQKIVERRAGTSDKQLLDRLKAIPPSRQAPAESSLGATGDTIQSPDIHDTSKKSRGTYEEAKSPGSVLSKAQSLGAQDAQRTTGKSKTPTAGQRKDVSTKPQPDVQDGSKQSKSSVGDWNGLGPLSSEGKDAIETETTITGDKPFPMERLMETSKKSESTTPKKQPTGSQGSVKEEKTPSAYQKKPPVAQDSQHHSDAPNTFDEKFIAPEPARAKTHDAFSAKEPYRDDTPSDQKLAPTLLSRELTSQVQPSSEPSHDASLHRDLSSKPSTIDEWRLTSAPLHDVTTSPGDDEVAMSTVDQKPTPMRQQESGEQRVEPPFPMETETSGVQRASPSFPGASVDGHATTDDRFAKQSIIDERDGKPVQMQTSSPDAHLASEPAKRETPKGHEISDLDLVSTPDGQISEATKARDDPATVPEDVYDVNLSTHDVTKDTFKETKVADSTPFSSVKPMHTQQPAITPSRQTQIEEARYKSMPSREIIPEQQKMAEREAGISGEQSSDPQKAIHPSRQKMAERGAGISGEESSDRQKAIHPSRQVAAAEDAPTGDAQDSQLTKGEPTMPTAEQKDWKDAKDDETIMTEEKSFSTERLREMFQESESTIPKTQPTDSQDYSAVDKTFPVYQKGPLAAQESQEEAQVIQAGEKEDSSTPEHQGSSGAPYTHNEKLSASAPARANIRDDHNAEEPYKKYTANDQKVAPSLPSKDPASQVQPLSESFQRAIPDGDSPSKSLTIDQWQRASAPLHGVSIDSGDAEAAVSSNNDQKSRPTSQEATLSSPAPIGADTSDVGRPAPSLPEAARADDVTIDDKLAKQAQPPASTRAHQTVETPHISNSSQYVQTGNLGITELAKPTVTDQEAMGPIAGRTSMDPQRAGTLPAEVAHSAQKSTPADKGSSHDAQPLSSAEPISKDSTVSAADYSNASQTIFRQQARPSEPSTIGIPASDTHGVIGKIQEVTPDNSTDDSGKTFVPSQEQVSHASKAIPGEEEMTSPPGATVFPTSDTKLASPKIQEVIPDDKQDIESITPLFSSRKQGSQVESAFGPGEVGPAEKKFAPSDQELHRSVKQPTSGKPRKEQTIVPAADQIKKQPTIIGQQDTPDTREALTSEDVLDTTPTHGDVHPISSIEPDRRPLSVQREEPTSATQEPPHHVAEDSLNTEYISTDALGNVQSKPSTPDALSITPGSTPDDVLVAEQISSPSGQDSVDPAEPALSLVPRNKEIRDSTPPAQLISSTDPSKGDAIVAVPDQAKDFQTTLGRQDLLSTQRPSGKVRENVPGDDSGKDKPLRPSSAVREGEPSKAVPASVPGIQPGSVPNEVALEQHFAPSGQDSSHPSQPPSSAEARSKEIGDLAPSAQLDSTTEQTNADAVVAALDQAKDSQTIPGQQVKLSAPSSYTQRPSGSLQEDEPTDNSGEAKSSKPRSVAREGKPSAAIPVSSPDTQHGATPDQVAVDEQKFDLSGQDAARSVQSTFSTEPTKEDTFIAATDQTSTREKVVYQNDMTPASDKEKTLFTGTPYASRETKKSTDDHIDEKHPGQRRVSPYRDVSERPEGPTPEVHSDDVIKEGPTPEVHSDDVIKETTFGSSQAETSKTIPDSTPIGDDARPSSGDVQASSLPETQDPLGSAYAHNVPADPLQKIKSSGLLSSDQALAPIMSSSVPSDASLGTVTDSVQPPQKASMASTVDLQSVPDAQHGIPQGEATPAEKKFPVSDQEPPHTLEPSSSAEPRKEEAYAVAGDQKDVPQGPERAGQHQVNALSSDARETLQKDQQPSHAVLPEQSTHTVPSDLDRPTPEVGSTVVDKETRLLSRQAQTLAAEPAPTLISGDVSPTSSLHNQDAQPPVTTQAPTTQSLQGSAPTQDDPLNRSESSPRRYSTDQVVTPRTSSAEPSGLPQGTEPGQDSSQSIQPPFSTEPTKDNTVPDKHMEIMTHQKAITPTQDTAKTPFPGTDQEAMAPIAESVDPQLASTLPAEVADSEQKSAPSEKGSTRAEEPLSPVEPKKADSNVSAAEYTNAPQMIFRQQAKPSAPSTIAIPASDTQGVIGKIQEGTPDRHTDDSGKQYVPNQEQVSHASLAIPGQEEMTSSPDTTVSLTSATQLAKAEVQESSPDNQQAIEPMTPLFSNGKQGSRVRSAYGPGEIDPAEKKFAPSDQELLHSAEQPTSGRPRKEQVVPTAEQIKEHPSIIGQQDTPDIREDPTSEDVLDTTPTHGDVHPTSSTEPDRRPLSVQRRELTSATQAPLPRMAKDSLDTEDTSTDASVQSLKQSMAPDDRGITPGSTPGHIAVAEQIYSPSGQDSAESIQPPFSTEPIEDKTVVNASDQTKDVEAVTRQQAITPAPDTVKTPFPGTQDASRKNQESIPDNGHVNEPFPREQVPPEGSSSELHEGQTNVPYGTNVNEKTDTSLSSQANSSDSGSDLAPTRSDVRPSIDEGPDGIYFPVPGSQTQMPAATQDVSLDSPSKVKSTGQEAKTPTGDLGSSLDTKPDSSQTRGKAALAGQNFAVSDQEFSRASKSSSFAEPRKEETDVAAADQMSVPQTTVAHKVTSATPVARESLWKDQESSHDGDHISNSANQLVISEDKASHVGRASEGPSSEVSSAVVDRKISPPSSKAHTSSTGPESTSISGDDHLSSADAPPTSSLHDKEVHTPAATQLGSTQAPLGSASTQNVTADSLGEIRSPRQPSTDQVMAPITSSEVLADAPQGTAPDQVSAHASQPSFSAEPSNETSHAGRASESHEGTTPEVHSPVVDAKTILPSRKVQTANTGSDSTPSSGDVSDRSSLQNQETQSSAAARVPIVQAQGSASSENESIDSLGDIKSPRQLPTKISFTAPSDFSQGTEPGTNSVQSSEEASLDFSSDEKPTTGQDDQFKTPNGGLSTSQVVGESESADSKWMDYKNFKGASADENSKKQQQIEQFDTRFKNNNKEADTTVRSNITTTFEEPPKQPSWPKGSMESSEEPENQQQTDQSVQSLEGNDNQAKQTKAHDTEMSGPEDMEASENTNQRNRISQVETLDHSGKEASGVQLLGKNTKDAPNSTEDAPGDVQAISKSKESSRLSEESKAQLRSEDKIGAPESPSAETGKPRGGLPENSYQNNSSQSQAEASDKSVQQTYPGIQNKDRDSADPTKPGDMED